MLKSKLLFVVILITVFSVSLLAQSKPASTTSIQKQKNILNNLTQKQTEILGKIIVLESKIEICAMNVIQQKTLSDKCATTQPTQELTAVYAEAFKDKELSRVIIAKTLHNYQMLRLHPRSALHVKRIAAVYDVKFQRIIIAQNMLLIELLEQLVRKK